ncbi:MAG: septal ring lytic transglycosylase RlpA family protein [Alphaproteobacteria bacterium]|nr:septal ring lytic transglycosylase RlpA family protein [Alphaproteobacteria bacterium]
MILAAGAMLLLAGCSGTQTPAPSPSALSDESAARLARAIEPGYKIGQPYRIAGQWYRPQEQFDMSESGIASWYGPGFHGRLTANGERYDMHAFTAAHRTLQLPSVVRVQNLDNGRSIIVRVNDRGPYVDGRIIDLSRAAAEALDLQHQGLAQVRLTVLPNESRRMAQMAQQGASVGSMDDRIVQLNEGPPPEPPVRLARTGPAGTLFLQAAAFSSEDYAERARGMLRGVGPVKITPFVRGDRTLYRVRVGPYADRNTAMTALERLREVGFEGAHLVASS